MAVQAQLVFSGLAGWSLPCGGGELAEEQMQALILSTAAGNKAHQHKYNNRAAGVASAAQRQSELTCHGGAGVVVVPPSRKRGCRDAEHGKQYVSSSSSLLPIPGMHMHQSTIAGHQLPAHGAAAPAAADRLAESAMASTSGRPASVVDALVAAVPELRLWQHGAGTDALVRAECDRMHAGLDQARKRQCLALANAAAAPALREVEAELAAARRRAAGLEELLRRAADERQAWCGLARSSSAVAEGLRATIDAVLLQVGAGGCTGAAAAARHAEEEGFGDSGGTDDDDAGLCCGYVDVEEHQQQAADTADATASSAAASRNDGESKWACRGCDEREASVLLLPCRHLCLCKACEPRTEDCPVCAGDKSASIHIEPSN